MIREWLIKRAMRTPYFNLDGYMNRDWLVPYREVLTREVMIEKQFVFRGLPGIQDGTITATDGTGPVSWRRPIAKLIQLCGLAIRIHQILRSDRGRDPHDYPWWYLTIILFGGYWEERYDDDGFCVSRRWHGPGSILFRSAGSWHRLDLPPGCDCWTLFITGPYQQGWGFNVNGRKVPRRNYSGDAQ